MRHADAFTGAGHADCACRRGKQSAAIPDGDGRSAGLEATWKRARGRSPRSSPNPADRRGSTNPKTPVTPFSRGAPYSCVNTPYRSRMAVHLAVCASARRPGPHTYPPPGPGARVTCTTVGSGMGGCLYTVAQFGGPVSHSGVMPTPGFGVVGPSLRSGGSGSAPLGCLTADRVPGRMDRSAPPGAAAPARGCRIYRRRLEVVRFAATDLSRSPSRRP
jgi:hypothetical protein